MRLLKRKHRLRLIEDWRNAWSFISVNCMALAVAIQGAWEFIPISLHGSLPHGMVTGITIALLVLGILGRLVKKEPCHVDSHSEKLENNPVSDKPKRVTAANKPLASKVKSTRPSKTRTVRHFGKPKKK